MASPFPESSSAAGQGRIIARLLPSGQSVLETITYQYPLKLISPASSVTHKSSLVFLLSYGGGLVGGDTVDLSIEARPGARLSLVTQGHTKIFTSTTPDVVTRQTLHVHIMDKAALCLLPDPVQPFRGSVYEQKQVFTVQGDDASLCLLDWVTQGRVARGEDWDLTKWTGRNEVWVSVPGSGSVPVSAASASVVSPAPRLLVRDSVLLEGDGFRAHRQQLRKTMHGMGVFGTLILRGSLVKALGDFFLAEFAALPRIGARDFRSAESKQQEDITGQSSDAKWRSQRIELEQKHGILWSAAQVRGCVVVKFGAATVEAGRTWIGDMLVREGSVADLFGEQALMCVR